MGYNNIHGKTYMEYEALVKKMLREQLSAISEEDFLAYFGECKDWIKKSYESETSSGASMLSYALFLNY